MSTRARSTVSILRSHPRSPRPPVATGTQRSRRRSASDFRYLLPSVPQRFAFTDGNFERRLRPSALGHCEKLEWCATDASRAFVLSTPAPLDFTSPLWGGGTRLCRRL